MSFVIQPRAPGAMQVGVKFTYDGINHTRTVNAVFGEDGYDEAATEERVEEVGRGVKNKIRLGVLKDDAEVAAAMVPPPAPEPEEA